MRRCATCRAVASNRIRARVAGCGPGNGPCGFQGSRWFRLAFDRASGRLDAFSGKLWSCGAIGGPCPELTTAEKLDDEFRYLETAIKHVVHSAEYRPAGLAADFRKLEGLVERIGGLVGQLKAEQRHNAAARITKQMESN